MLPQCANFKGDFAPSPKHPTFLFSTLAAKTLSQFCNNFLTDYQEKFNIKKLYIIYKFDYIKSPLGAFAVKLY